MEVKLDDEEIENPIVKTIVTILATLFAFTLVGAILLAIAAVFLSPILLLAFLLL